MMGHGDGLQVMRPTRPHLPHALHPPSHTLAPFRLQVRFRTYAHFDDLDLNLNRGYGLIEVAYNGSVVNSTFMGSKMRGGIDMDPKAIVVRYDDGGLTVTHDGELVIADQIPGWAPTTDWQFGGRADGRPQGQPLDRRRARVVGLPPRHRRRRVRCHFNGSDVSPLAAPSGYTYTADPAVFAFSPTTGPTDGNTTVVLKGSMLAGGSDYRCRFGAEGTTVAATYEPDEEELTCVSPRVDAGLLPGSDRGAAVVALEVSLNNRYYSSTGVPWRFYLPPDVDDARGPDRCARRPAPAPLPSSLPHPSLPAAATRRRRASARSSPSSVPTSAAETTISRASSRRPR